jgi:RHS repeat-associated protein
MPEPSSGGFPGLQFGPLGDKPLYIFGEQRVITNNVDNRYKFTGLERDAESGLDHTLNRMYASNLGRWQSPDPVCGNPLNPQSWNRYAYVQNNPCNATDPLGLMCTQEGCEGGGGSIATDPSDPCAYLMTNDASCQQMPGLWPNGDPIYGGPGVNIDVGGWGGGGGGGVWNEAVPPFGGGGFGLPCDFGTCGPGMPSGNGFLSIGDVLPWGGIIRTTTWACGLNPAACVAAGLAGADVALLGWDVYQGYRLAQAYGYFLPKAVAKPVPTTKATTGSDFMDALQQYNRDLKACAEQYPPGPARQDCFKRAKALFDLRTGKIPGPVQ